MSWVMSCRYPTQWEGSSIVVLGQYIIQAPYLAENIQVLPGQEGSADGLNRLAKVVRVCWWW